MTAQDRKIPTHELTYARLRDMVLFGHLQPGQPVTIAAAPAATPEAPASATPAPKAPDAAKK